MSHALAARAASIGASLLLMSGLLLLALTMTYAINEVDWVPAPTPIEMTPPPATAPPPTPPARPETSIIRDSTEISPLAPLEPLTPSEPATSYDGPPAMQGPVEITAPRWLRRPHDLGSYYPPRAVARTIEGAVQLDCLVVVTGALQCRVVSETPQGWGFGEAALRISRDHRMAPAMADGQPVEGRYRMSVPFTLE